MIVATFGAKRAEAKQEKNVMIELQASDPIRESVNESNNRWKVSRRRRRRWSRDLFIQDDFGYITEAELAELSKFSEFDVSKLKERRERHARTAMIRLNKLVMGMVFEKHEPASANNSKAHYGTFSKNYFPALILCF